jgi:hypothetical protein
MKLVCPTLIATAIATAFSGSNPNKVMAQSITQQREAERFSTVSNQPSQRRTTSKIPTSVKREIYKLTPKYKAGDRDFFSYDLRFTRLAPGGKILGKNLIKGYFTQKVVGRRPDGSLELQVVRNYTKLELTDENNKAILSRTLDFAEGLTYKVCYEDLFDFFPVDTSGWPRDIMGFMMFEQVYTSHQFFQTIMTETHGGIDKLDGPGSRVVMPDSNKTGTLGLAGLANLEVTRGESTLQFLGVGSYKQTKALVLLFDVPYLLKIHELLGNKNGAGRELIRGLIWVSHHDGKILGGRLYGANFVALPDSRGDLQASDVILEGHLERLTPKEYARETGAEKQDR